MVLSLLILFNVFETDYGQSIGIILITSAHKFSFLLWVLQTTLKFSKIWKMILLR